MKNIETEIYICASIDTVWEVFTDLGLHSEWSPFLTKIDGSLIEDESIMMTVQLGDKKPEVAEPVLKKIISKKEVHFLMDKWPLIKGEHYFIFEKASNIETKFIHGENFYGLLPLFLWGKLRPLFHKGFIGINEALKKRVELLM